MKKSFVYAGIAIFFWSTIATVSKLLLGAMGSMQVLAISSLFAFLFLLILNLAKGNLKEMKALRFKDYAILLGLGVLGIFLYNLFLYLGMERMNGGTAFIINYLWPLMILLFACFILKEKFNLRKLFATLLSFGGVILITAGELSGGGNLIGALCCVGAAVVYGLFSVLNKKCNYNNYLAMMIYYFFAFLLGTAYLLISGGQLLPTLAQVPGLLWSGIFTYAIAYTFWALALAEGETAKISNLAYITPFLSLVWTTLILKEPFDPFALIGLLLIVGGILIQNIKLKKAKAYKPHS
jgi:drug/metabolite transporter (DMT)-like permease